MCEVPESGSRIAREPGSFLRQEAVGPAVSVSFVPDCRMPRILADRKIIRQAVEALCQNAFHAVVGGGSIKIATRVEEPGMDIKGMTVVIEMIDDGVGMDDAPLPQAVEPFFTTREVGKDVGLGLGFVDGAARLYHGRLKLQSRPGRGTHVRLVLPLVEE